MKRYIIFIAALLILCSCSSGSYGISYEGDAVESLSESTKAALESLPLPDEGPLVVRVDSVCKKNDYLDVLSVPEDGAIIQIYLEPRIIKADIYGAAGGELTGEKGKEYLAQQMSYAENGSVDQAVLSMADFLIDVQDEAQQKYSGWAKKYGASGFKALVDGLLGRVMFLIKPYDNFWGSLLKPFYLVAANCIAWTGSVVSGLFLLVFLLFIVWTILFFLIFVAIKARKKRLSTTIGTLSDVVLGLSVVFMVIYAVCLSMPRYEVLLAMGEIYGYSKVPALVDAYTAHVFAPSSVWLVVWTMVLMLIYAMIQVGIKSVKNGELDLDKESEKTGEEWGEKIGGLVPLLLCAVIIDKIFVLAFLFYYLLRVLCGGLSLLIIYTKPAQLLSNHSLKIVLAALAVGLVGFFCFGFGRSLQNDDPMSAAERTFAHEVYSQGQIDSTSYVFGAVFGNSLKAGSLVNTPAVDINIAQKAISKSLRHQDKVSVENFHEVYGMPYEEVSKAYMSYISSAKPSGYNVDTVSILAGAAYAPYLKDSHLAYGMGEINMEMFRKGADDSVGERGYWVDSSIWEKVVNDWQAKRTAFIAERNLEAAGHFLEKNASKFMVGTSESGLQYIINDVGGERKIRSSSTVRLKYTGMDTNGKIFDSQVTDFRVNRLIPGLKEGLCMLGEGGRMILYIPPQLAYGSNWSGNIEPNSLVVYNVEVEKVIKR